MIALLLGLFLSSGTSAQAAVVSVPGGSYQPFFSEKDEVEIQVGALKVDRTPVTNSMFQLFLRQHPEWQKSRIAPLLADEAYLKRWTGDLTFAKEEASHPVSHISWFAARAYCESKGARLPTIAEWEYFADTRSPDYEAEALEWYSKPGDALRPVGMGKANRYGLHDTRGLVWEWVEDFSGVFMSGDSRTSDNMKDMFCGGAAIGSKDPRLYAAFIRYAFRSSLKARYTTSTLSFRCVRD